MSTEKTRPTIASTLFTLAEVDRKQRFELWRDSISCMFDVSAQRDVRENFDACIETTLFGSMILAHTSTLPQRWQRTEMNIARDGLDCYAIRLLERGQSEQHDHPGTNMTQRPGDILVADLGRISSSETSAFSNLTLVIPRPLLSAQLHRADDQHQRLLHRDDPFTALLRDHMLSLKQQLPRMSSEQVESLIPATTGLIAACLNNQPPGQSDNRYTRDICNREAIRRYIDHNLHDSALSPATVARAIGVSRSRLYQLTDELGGIASYIRERRLSHAFRQLVQSAGGRSISAIAMDCGFSSSSDFSRSFKRRFGLTAREVQRQADEHKRSASQAGPVDRQYERWVELLTR